MENLILKLTEILKTSEFADQLRKINGFTKQESFSLSESEITQLKNQGNFAEDWSVIRKSAPTIDLNRIWHNYFYGSCIFSDMSGKVDFLGKERVCGLYHSRICDSFLGENVLVFDVKLLQDYIVSHNVILCDVKEISYPSSMTCGLGTSIKAGPETGGRQLFSSPELDGNIVSALLASTRQVRDQANGIINLHVKKMPRILGFIEEGSVISHLGVLRGSYVGASTQIVNALSVENSCLWGTAQEPVFIGDGVICKDSILHRGVQVENMAILQASVIFDHAEISNHMNINHSWIGPNCALAEGEITSCLLGPFVSAHHQSLLISAIWPEGKGNIGYGANVGSNHTGRLPDQEIFPGEACFFGLGVNIKFPANFQKAPYSLFATGISVLPQKIEMPFSLIKESSSSEPGVPSVFNEIVPGWVLSDNIFLLRRNEMKFKDRNKCKRYPIPFEVFKPDIVDDMIEARKRLSEASGRNYYTDAHIEGLGKNYMTEDSRKSAIDIYTFYISYYALESLFHRVFNTRKSSLSLGDDHAIKVFKQEMSSLKETEALLIFKDMLKKEVDDLVLCLSKDDSRGKRIMPGYSESHGAVSDNTVVAFISKRNAEQSEMIDKFISEKN